MTVISRLELLFKSSQSSMNYTFSQIEEYTDKVEVETAYLEQLRVQYTELELEQDELRGAIKELKELQVE